ncbi:MAG: ASKHA domain-containing protein [Methanomassiliicoccales archaeon]
MKFKIRFEPEGKEIEVDRGTTILEAAASAGIEISSSCGGRGTCKKCRVQVDAEKALLQEKTLSKNQEGNSQVLACQSHVVSDVVVFIPEETRGRGHRILVNYEAHSLGSLSPLVEAHSVKLVPPTLWESLADLERLARALGRSQFLDFPLSVLQRLPKILREHDEIQVLTASEDVGGWVVAVEGGKERSIGGALDIGTTTVVLSLLDLATGESLITVADRNRQSRAGDDVISRIAYAEEGGLPELQDLIIETVNGLLEEASRSLGSADISALSVAGNTTMVHLFLGLDPSNIRREPYVPVTNIPPMFRGKDLDLKVKPEAPIYFVPGRASFVGGDVVADVLSSGMHERDELSLLIDVGTNGEVVVGDREFLVACSTSAGPAFEGGEVAAGMRAIEGAIEKVSISPSLEVSFEVIGGTKALGICGSGLIDLVAQMLLRGLVDRKGRIQYVDEKRTRRMDEGNVYVLQQSDHGSREIVISDSDLANIIRTKAAIYAGCSVLLSSVNKSFEDLEKVYVAGGFGNYLDLENAITIGLLPDLPRERFSFIGNAALAGAVETLLSKERRAQALRVHQDMTYLELSTMQKFFDEFSSASFLPHTDLERFPSVKKRMQMEAKKSRH